jgi:polyhydroxyalkanoate synthesis regulator phasin
MSEPSKPDDPFSRMLQFYDDWAKTWAGAMSQMVTSKPLADATAQQMEAGMTAMGLMRRQMADMMNQSLQQMNMPSRQEVLSLAERLTQIEMRLDDLEAKMDQALDLLQARGQGGA